MGSSLEELDAIKRATEVLEPLDEAGRARAMAWIGSALGVHGQPVGSQSSGLVPENFSSGPEISGRGVGEMTSKQFMAQKSPRTAVERVTCLGYFMTYGKETPHFKTKDLTDMNREAAGPSFSNISQAAKDAVKAQYMAPAGKGARQLTALGDEIVEALPDIAKVKEVASRSRPRRTRRPRRSSSMQSAG